MENKKMTKKEFFKGILEIAEIAENPIFVAHIEHELELLDKKSSASRVTKTQEENEKIKAIICEELRTIGHPVTITELINGSDNLKKEDGTSLSNQKISALLKQLVDDEIVIKVTEKKKSYFSIG